MKDAIVASLRGMLPEARAVSRGYFRAAFPQKIERVEEAITRLCPFVRATELFADGDSFMMQFPDASAVRVGPPSFALAMLGLADIQGPEAAADWLQRLSKKKTATGRQVIVVQGVELKEPARIGGIDLVPLHALPVSQAVLEFVEFLNQAHHPGNTLCFAIKRKPETHWRERLDDVDVATTVDDWGNFQQRVTEVVRVVGYAEDGAPSAGQRWADYVDPDLAVLKVSSGFFGPPDDMPKVRRAVGVSAASVAALEQFDVLPASVKRIVGISADRLMASRRRLDPGDRSIDLSIAMEALFGSDRMDFTYKLSLRSALLLEATIEARREVRETVKALYVIRGKVVHGQELKPKDKPHQTLRDAEQLCARAIRRVAELGAISWEDVELGASIDGPHEVPS